MALGSLLKKISGTKPRSATKKSGVTRRAKVGQKTNTSVDTAAAKDLSLAARIKLAPLTSEKGFELQARNQLVFRTVVSATKGQIRQAVQAVYEVKPLAIRTIIMSGKSRRRGQVVGRTAAWKKAYVKVADIKSVKLTA